MLLRRFWGSFRGFAGAAAGRAAASAVCVVWALCAGPALAQAEPERAANAGGASTPASMGAGVQGGPPIRCPRQHRVVLAKNSGGAAPEAADLPAGFKPGTGYNDAKPNAHFADTTKWSMPVGFTCEALRAEVSWTVKNLSGATLQGGDSTGLWFNKVAVVSHKVGPLASGASKSYAQTLTQAQVAQGRVTLIAQDDLAVTEFKVQIDACCVTPMR